MAGTHQHSHSQVSENFIAHRIPAALSSLYSATMVNPRTVLSGISLGEAVEPILEALRKDLERADLPTSFDGIKEAIRLNVAMIAELGRDTLVSEEIVGWWRRVEWLEAEYESLRSGRKQDTESQDKLSGWRSFFVENGVNGVPRAWLESLRPQRTEISPFEIVSPVRLIGAELFMLFDRIQALGGCIVPRMADLDRFLNHVSLHTSEFQRLNLAGTTPLDLGGAIEDLSKIKACALRWSEGEILTDEFRTLAWGSYQDLSARTTLVDVPCARDLNLSLLEFNTEYSGLCRRLLPLLENIDRGLLIDPSLNCPQNGLGATYPPEATEAVLRSVGCRVFLLQLGVETVGYYIFVPNPPSAIMPTQRLFEDLADQGVIKDALRARYGFFRGVAITKEARNILRNAGISGYRILDHQMAQTALFEGCDALVCTVRGGPNRNTAKASHLKVGWNETTYEIKHGVPGGNILEVLTRDTSTGVSLPPNFIPPAPENWGLNPHYRPHTSAQIDDPRFRDAQTVSDYEAEELCKMFVAGWNRATAVHAYHGSFGFYISFASPRSHQSVTLQQLRPGFDFWYCAATERSGALHEQFQAISQSNYLR